VSQLRHVKLPDPHSQATAGTALHGFDGRAGRARDAVFQTQFSSLALVPALVSILLGRCVRACVRSRVFRFSTNANFSLSLRWAA